MQSEIVSNIKDSAKYWWLLLIQGLLFIVVGIWALKTPLGTYLTLTVLFSVLFLVSGILEIIYAIASRKFLRNWGWSLVGGALDFLIGIILVSHPGITMAVLPIFIGFVLLFRSFMAIGWSFFLNNQGIKNWGWILAAGILGVIFSFIVLWNPFVTGLAIAIFTGLAFIFTGFSQIILSFRVKSLKKWI